MAPFEDQVRVMRISPVLPSWVMPPNQATMSNVCVGGYFTIRHVIFEQASLGEVIAIVMQKMHLGLE